MFSLLSLVLVALAAALAYWLASSAIVSELEKRSDHAAQRVEAYLDLRGEDARQTVAALARDAGVRTTLAGVASARLESGNPEVVGLAGRSGAGTDLDVLEILDPRGTILSSAHWKASYGSPHLEAMSLARESDGSPAAMPVDVRGRGSLCLLSARLVQVGDAKFAIVGGYFLGAESIRELKNLLDVDVMLVPLFDDRSLSDDFEANAGGDGVGEKNDDNPEATSPGIDVETKAGESRAALVTGGGAAISNNTHVIREVYLPRTGSFPVAKFVVGVSRAGLRELAHDLRRAFMIAAAGALVFSWMLALILSRGTTRRLELLTAGARRVAEGDLETPVSGEGSDEVGQLVSSFNKMVVDLKESRSKSARMERIAAWREVARRIAHEIKNALSPIQLSIENVQRGYAKGGKDFESVLTKATETVREEVDGLRAMVDEFSQLARMPAPTLERNDLRKVAEKTVSLHESTRPGVKVELTAPSTPVEADIDPGLLSRALGNILANAIEACGESGHVGVSVECTRGAGRDDDAGRPRIVVKDNGAGLQPNQLERVFEPYYTTRDDGTGLGLAIAMKIVTDHGGNIEVESKPGEGSTFSIVLPAAK